MVGSTQVWKAMEESCGSGRADPKLMALFAGGIVHMP